MRAGGQDDLGGADVPDPLPGNPGCCGAGEVVGAVLDGDDVVRVVGPKAVVRFRTVDSSAEISSVSTSATHSRAGLPSMVSARDGAVDPDRKRASQLGWSSIRITRARCGRPAGGCGQAGRAAADDQDVGVDVPLVVLGVVLLRVQLAEAVRAALPSSVDQGDGGGREHGLGHVPGEARSILARALDSSTPADMMPRDGPREGVAGVDPAVGEQGGGEGVPGRPANPPRPQ